MFAFRALGLLGMGKDPIASRLHHVQGKVVGQPKAQAEKFAAPALGVIDRQQRAPLPGPNAERRFLRVKDDVFADTVAGVKLHLRHHFLGGISVGKDLKYHLGCDPALDPLAVGATRTFRSAEGGKHIRCHDDLGMSLDRIPKEVSRHKSLRIVRQM
ncbi:MAG: hypothetical protein R3F11_17150 [Verrucomicrobiales bacterium]